MFLAYLRGIETAVFTLRNYDDLKFLAYLRGIETILLVVCLAFLGIVFSLPKRD